MVSCEGCGAGISENDDECPYCGHSVRKRVDVRIGDRTHGAAREQADIRKEDRTYSVERSVDGTSSVRFGDGHSGSRLPSGRDSVSSQYRAGGGSSGNISTGLVQDLDKLYILIKKVPNPKRKGSRDEGVVLLEAFGTINDLLSFYQDGISHEAHLDTDDRKRISKKEKRVRPKLKELVRFCEKVEPRTMGKMGISDADIHKIRAAAIKVLQMTESAVCSRCGAMNRPESSRCRKCGRSL